MKLTVLFQTRNDETLAVQSEYIKEFKGESEHTVYNQYYAYLRSQNGHPFLHLHTVTKTITQ